MKIVFSFLVLLILAGCSKNSFDSFLEQHGLPLNFEGRFDLVSFNESPAIVVGEERSKKGFIKVKYWKKASLEEAHNEIKNNLVRLASQYQFSMAPYPGQLSTIANCGKEFLPKIVKYEWGAAIYAHANERMALTICQGDIAFYEYSQSFFWDKKGMRLLNIELYQKKGEVIDLNLLFSNKHMVRLTRIDLEKYSPLFKF